VGTVKASIRRAPREIQYIACKKGLIPDRKHVSFLYSYPNHIPVPASAVERIIKVIEPFEYGRLYGAF
jgi:hypothetical protein